jgi:hypothetical protein
MVARQFILWKRADKAWAVAHADKSVSGLTDESSCQWGIDPA